MRLRDFLLSLPQQERQRLLRAANIQRELLTSYAQAHEEIGNFFRIVFARTRQNLTISELRGIISARSSSAFIDQRVRVLNIQIDHTMREASPDLLDFITKQAKRELRQLELGDIALEDIDERILQVHLIEAVRRIRIWNRHIRPELMRSLLEGVRKNETTAQLANRVNQSIVAAGYTPPIARARAHMMANSRYAIVSGANAAREAVYQRVASELGLEMKKMWLASISSCCRSCALLHGQVVDVGTMFDWQNLNLSIPPYQGRLQHPPLHPNCRCRVIPVPPTLELTQDYDRLLQARRQRLKEF